MLSVRDSIPSILSSLAIAKANTKYLTFAGRWQPSDQGLANTPRRSSARLGGLWDPLRLHQLQLLFQLA